MADIDDAVQPPARLRGLASWQAGKVSTLGSRMTARHMPLSARSDFAVLAALEEYGALSQAELGRRLGLDRNDVSGIVVRLEGHDQVDREADSTDRRRNVVTLTDAGRQYLEEIQRHAVAAQDELLTGLNQAERKQLHVLMTKLLDSHKPQSA